MRYEKAAICRKREAGDLAGVAVEHEFGASGFDVPYPDRMVARPGCQPAAIRGCCDAVDRAAMALEDLEDFRSRGVMDTHGSVSATRGQHTAVGGPRGSEDGVEPVRRAPDIPATAGFNNHQRSGRSYDSQMPILWRPRDGMCAPAGIFKNAPARARFYVPSARNAVGGCHCQAAGVRRPR